MGVWFEITRLATVANVVLLLGLGFIWARNYYRLRSKHTLGLLVFAVLMLTENGLALYYFSMHPSISRWFFSMPGAPELAMMILRVLMTVALLFLAWVTWD